MINTQEILVANGTGLLVLLFAVLSRIEVKDTRHLSDRMFNVMIGITCGALVAESLTFLLDGVPGAFINTLLRMLNGYLFFASSGVGMLWVLYQNLRIYRNTQNLKRFLFPVVLPCAAVYAMILCDVLGAGLLFSVSEQNVYERGPLFVVPYLILMFDYILSLALAVNAVRKNNYVRFFPVHYFIIPCIVGTCVQGLFYGISAGWLCVSLAFLFVQMQLYHQNAFIDDLSGLYNRKYYNCVVDKLSTARKHSSLSGIMMDINDFKTINDRFGHSAGDDAIRSLAQILMDISHTRDMVFRYAGDEFIIVSPEASEAETQALADSLSSSIEQFNQTAGKPYTLSVSAGYVISDTSEFEPDEFLRSMDKKMYEAKAEYYSRSGTNRRKRHTPDRLAAPDRPPEAESPNP